MTVAEILEQLEQDGVSGCSVFEGPKDEALVVPAAKIVDVCTRLKNSHQLSFEQCVLVTGTHITEVRDKKSKEVVREECIEVMYHLRSLRHHTCLAVKVKLDINEPRIASVAGIWSAANWHERETYDLVGVHFEGHPNLIRILLPQDWEGHPLRKDYEFPKEYHDISLEVDPPWPQQ